MDRWTQKNVDLICSASVKCGIQKTNEKNEGESICREHTHLMYKSGGPMKELVDAQSRCAPRETNKNDNEPKMSCKNYAQCLVDEGEKVFRNACGRITKAGDTDYCNEVRHILDQQWREFDPNVNKKK